MSTLTIAIISGSVLFLGFIMYNSWKMKNTPEVKKSDKILTLTNKNFKSNTRKGLVLVDFWAPWCGPCKMVTPILNNVAEELHGKVTIGKINVDHNQLIAGKHKVRNIPTLILYQDGIEVKRFVGVKTKKFLLKEILALG
jgi:thioredoxin 1